MPVYGFDVLDNSYENGQYQQILFEHDKIFTKEQFIEQKNKAMESFYDNHPERLAHVTGLKKIPIQASDVAKEMIRLFGYRPLIIEVLVEMEERNFFTSDGVHTTNIYDSETDVFEKCDYFGI